MPVFYLFKRQEKVYRLLTELAGVLCEASQLTGRFAGDSALPSYHLDLLQATKKRGDKMTALLWEETGRQFVLPFDPEDITALARKLNKALVMIVMIAENLACYQICSRQDKELSAMIALLENITREIYQVIAGLPELKSRRNQLGNKCAAIEAYRQQSQRFYLTGTGALYRRENLRLGDILSRQQVYRVTAKALESCYELSYSIREMTIKYV